MLTTITITDPEVWNETLQTMPYAHILQSWEWGEFKRTTTGWLPKRLAFSKEGKVIAMASVLTRTIGPLKVMYVPKGPALDYQNSQLLEAVITTLKQLARKNMALWIKIDPDVIAATGLPDTDEDSAQQAGQQIIELLTNNNWHYSDDQVQFRNTISLDLTQSEDDLLMAMSQNTRRKIRTAYKKDVTVREANATDLETLYNLYRITGERDDFLTRPPEYYERAWSDFIRAGLAHALIAEVNNVAIAHVILFHFGQKCWYFYGASSDLERQRMPNYALQWESIKWAKAQGYTIYDMWGAPNTFNETDSMWGVYEFKRGFRGTVVRHIGAWDYAPFPPLYFVYTQLWPRLRSWLRNRQH